MYRVTKETRNHESGTKQYHFYRVDNCETNHTVVIFRWGKTGEWGKFMVEHGPQVAMNLLYDGRRRDKIKRGYTGSGAVEGFEFETFPEAKGCIGTRFGEDEKVVAALETIRAADPDAPAAGRPADPMEALRRAEEKREDEARMEEKAIAAPSNTNTRWGMF